MLFRWMIAQYQMSMHWHLHMLVIFCLLGTELDTFTNVVSFNFILFSQLLCKGTDDLRV